jgi:hypothetical protein
VNESLSLSVPILRVKREVQVRDSSTSWGNAKVFIGNDFPPNDPLLGMGRQAPSKEKMMNPSGVCLLGHRGIN